MSEPGLRSRRAILTGAAAAGAAVAANAVVAASPTLAADAPVLLGVANTSTAATTLTGNLPATGTLTVSNSATDAPAMGVVGSVGQNPGRGVAGLASTTGTGVLGVTGSQQTIDAIGQLDASLSGVYGWADAGDGVTTFGSGVFGVSPDFGVYGIGGVGVRGEGGFGGSGVEGLADGDATTPGVGVFGDGGVGGIGLEGMSTNGYGLYVTGKVKLASRSGRLKVASGKRSISKTVKGMTAGNIVIAVLQTPETGTWVRAAVAATDKFTVYFNRALPSSSVVGWIVLG